MNKCKNNVGAGPVSAQRGITLIALVITIIVMLILVAVTITMAVNGGLFEYAGNAGTQTNAERDAEQEFANLEEDMTYDDLIDKYTGWKEDGGTGEKIEGVDLNLLNVGDYVNYPVEYTNVATCYTSSTGEEENYPRDEFTGWRVLSKETDDQGNIMYIKLISAGVPLSYYHNNNSDTSAQALTTDFLTTEITSTLTQYKFYKCGFEKVTGATLAGTFTNEFTDTDKVHALTKGELDKAVIDLGGTAGTEAVTDSKYKDLFAVPCKGNKSSEYAAAWNATSDGGGRVLWYVDYEGSLKGWVGGCVMGVRSVVSLKPNVQFTPATEQINGTTTWDISI